MARRRLLTGEERRRLFDIPHDETAIVGGIDFNNLTGFINEPRTVGLEYKTSF
mgnify:CR=1 FL=1